MGDKTQYYEIDEGKLSAEDQKALAAMRKLWKEAKVIKDSLSTRLSTKVAAKVKVPAGKVIKIHYQYGLCFSFADPKSAKKADKDALDLS